eukprot:TRINITY_DN1071_c0_g1_i2.p1 TRINITY_DN1071_c0_g1~~TRINITY_DN1071_c0_g1_i2.p1  ORF type:complete len:147 (-),score=28.67 TRINITY_DN1071_c0_g1_i2:285-725(-)
MAKRLQKELKDFQTEPPAWCKAELLGDGLYKWKASIIGPEGTPYEKGTFGLELDVPQEYPFKPPKLKFTTKIYHPNIKADGSVCAEVLGEAWSPQLKIQDVLLTMRSLLSEPNPDNPLEAEIAHIFKTDRAAFNKTAKEWTKKHAK